MGSFVQPTGTVQVLLFNDATCTNDFGAPIATLAEATADNAFFDAITRTSPTVFSWRVVYGGDTNYTMAKGDCMTQRWYAKPDVALAVHNGAHGTVTSVIAGTKVHLATEVTGAYGTPTSSVTVRIADNSSCSNGTSLGSGTLSAGALDDTSIDYTPKTAGTVWFQATYKGDGSYVTRKSACVALSVAAVVANPSPTPTSTPAPTGAPKPTTAPTRKPSAGASGGPAGGPTTAPTAGPSPAPDASDTPATAPVDPGSTAAPTDPAATPAAAPSTAPVTEAPAAGGPTTTGTGADSSSDGLPIVPIALLLILVAVAGSWFIGASRQRNPQAAR